MRIADFCTRSVVIVSPQQSLRDVSLATRNAHVGCVVVAAPGLRAFPHQLTSQEGDFT